MHCDLDLWPVDFKIYRAHPWLMGSLHVKFHDDRCKGKAVMRRKPKCGRQTDGQTDMVIPVYPPNFVAGGIIIYVSSQLFTSFKMKNKTKSSEFLTVYQTYHENRDSRVCSSKLKHEAISRASGLVLPGPSIKPSFSAIIVWNKRTCKTIT